MTTLSVYLGLLMVGGVAPQVLAHSATTRNFEITEEIEIKDDLDKNPPDAADSAESRMALLTYFQDVEYFINSLKRFNGSKFDVASDSFEVTQTTQLPCIPANRIGSYTANKFVTPNDKLKPLLESFSKLLTDGYSLGDCLTNSRFAPNEATDSKFNFRLDNKVFAVEVAVKKNSAESAKLLAADLANTFKELRRETTDAVRLKLYDSTSFKAENDQIFVITNLPRAGLDPLLANDAK